MNDQRPTDPKLYVCGDCGHPISSGALPRLCPDCRSDRREMERAIAVEQYWKDKQGDEYGSY